MSVLTLADICKLTALPSVRCSLEGSAPRTGRGGVPVTGNHFGPRRGAAAVQQSFRNLTPSRSSDRQTTSHIRFTWLFGPAISKENLFGISVVLMNSSCAPDAEMLTMIPSHWIASGLTTCAGKRKARRGLIRWPCLLSRKGSSVITAPKTSLTVSE